MSAHLFTPRRLAGAAAGSERGAGRSMESSSLAAPKAREAGALVLVAAAVYLALSLGSLRIDPADPAVSGADWVGPVGALVASVLVRGFGVVAWLAPVELVLLAIPFFRPAKAPVTSLRVTGDVVVAVILSSLVHIA